MILLIIVSAVLGLSEAEDIVVVLASLCANDELFCYCPVSATSVLEVRCNFSSSEPQERTIVIKSQQPREEVDKLSMLGTPLHHLIFERGSLSGIDDLNLTTFGTVEFREKSLRIRENQLTRVTLNKINKVKFLSRSVSAASGSASFRLLVSEIQTMAISAQTFDVLNVFSAVNVGTLILNDAAFKPNVPVHTPNMVIKLVSVSSIPVIPSDTFSSSKLILIENCRIKDIKENAFSGISIYNVTLQGSSIDRLHQRAFPEKSLIGELTFNDCSIASISQNAFLSAISNLDFRNNDISSISKEAIHIHVANVTLVNNSWPLSRKSLIFRSWNNLEMNGNRIKFMDSGALIGISHPSVDTKVKVTLTFMNNEIWYANRNALKTDLPDSVIAKIEGNVFHRNCDCEYENWLDIVIDSSSSTTFWSQSLKNSSSCLLKAEEIRCFGTQPEVNITTYLAKNCEPLNEQECFSEYVSPWDFLNDQVEINTDKGILLVILCFVVTSSLVVLIITMIRWIFYTLANRHLKLEDEEWNFTKIEPIEERRSPSMIEHYESLPLTQRESLHDDDEDEEEKESSESKIVEEKAEVEKEAKKSPIKEVESTFFDEMIGLLKERLEDPNNYATVADTRNGCLYEDPFEVKKD